MLALLGLRHGVALRTVKDKLCGLRLEDGGPRTVDAHWVAVAVREATADGHFRRKRIARQPHRLLGLLLFQPRHGDLRVLFQRLLHRLAECDGPYFGVREQRNQEE
ncbi:MAG: hypothetical protein BWY76_03226 [bacterium ADurb.Bin429]|nr:MAG: hypothetical protein BWY76_03226 [bacterium ADurb.Bin429]